MKRFFALFVCLAAFAAPAVAQTPCPCAEKKEPPPPPALTGGVGIGLAINSGNSDTTNFSFTLGLKYDPKTKNVVKLDGYYLYGQTDSVTSTQKASLVLRDEYSFSERFFGFGELGYLHDRFKGITYLITPIVGAGYKVVKTKEITLAFDGGVGLAMEQDAGFPSRTSGAFRAGEAFEWQLSSFAKLTQNAYGLWKMDDTQDYLFHFDAGLVTPVSKALELKVAYMTDYKNRPRPATLKKTDRSLIAAIGFKF
jgi:putative salt-induced outer membrane protein YdiY